MDLDTLVETKPESYFDLSNFRYKDIFEGVEVVWDVLKKLPQYLEKADFTIHPETQIHPTAIVDKNVAIGKGSTVGPYVVIEGPTVIGENCVVQCHAHIRGNVLVGDYTRIGNYTEVVQALLLGGTGQTKKEQSHFAHYNYIGYCVIGRNVVLGARVTTSSLRADWKPVTVRIGDEKYETGLPQFSTIIGDNVQVGCHTLIDPGSLIGKNSWINGSPFEWKGYLAPGKFAKGRNTHYEIVDKKPT